MIVFSKLIIHMMSSMIDSTFCFWGKGEDMSMRTIVLVVRPVALCQPTLNNYNPKEYRIICEYYP